MFSLQLDYNKSFPALVSYHVSQEANTILSSSLITTKQHHPNRIIVKTGNLEAIPTTHSNLK